MSFLCGHSRFFFCLFTWAWEDYFYSKILSNKTHWKSLKYVLGIQSRTVYHKFCWHIKIYQWNRFFLVEIVIWYFTYAQGILGISSDRSCKNSEACFYTLSPSLYYIIMQNWACRIFSGEIRVLSVNKFCFGDILLTTEDVW